VDADGGTSPIVDPSTVLPRQSAASVLPPRPRPGGPAHAGDRPPAPARRERDRRRSPAGRGLPAAAALCGIVAVGFGVASVSHGDRPTLAAEVATTAPMTTSTTPDTTSTPDTARTRGTPAATSAPRRCAVTTPADSTSALAGPCQRSTAVGAAITSGGHRYAVGEAGDEVLVGDWSCRGEPVPAVIRPSTGDVFVFDRWASTDEDRTATPAMRAEAGSHLETDRGDATCPTLLAGVGDRVTAVPIDRPPS